MDTKPNVGYYHFRILSYKYNPAITVAYRRYPDYFELGFSFCAPDDQFCRKTGRDDAEDRLNTIPVQLSLDKDNLDFGYSQQRFLIEKFMLHLFHHVPDYPVQLNWYRDFTDSYYVERVDEYMGKLWEITDMQFGRKHYEPNTVKLRNPMDYLI